MATLCPECQYETQMLADQYQCMSCGLHFRLGEEAPAPRKKARK